MKDIKRKYNLMVDLSKFISNKKIMNQFFFFFFEGTDIK